VVRLIATADRSRPKGLRDTRSHPLSPSSPDGTDGSRAPIGIVCARPLSACRLVGIRAFPSVRAQRVETSLRIWATPIGPAERRRGSRKYAGHVLRFVPTVYAFSVDAFATERSDLGASGEFNAEETFRRTVSTSTVCDCAKRIPEISEVGALVSSRTHVLAFCTKGRSANAFSREDRNVSTSIPPGPAGSGPSGFLPSPMSKNSSQHHTKTSYEYALSGRSSSAKRRPKGGTPFPIFLRAVRRLMQGGNLQLQVLREDLIHRSLMPVPVPELPRRPRAGAAPPGPPARRRD
jgi:hypothetical protein